MNIEAGKFCKTREGRKARIYATDGPKSDPIHGAIFIEGNWHVWHWNMDGRFLITACHKHDIVSEWVEPHPAESWPVDAKILVLIDGHTWEKRHFAKYENGRVYAWKSGATSWTTRAAHPWDEAKLMEADDGQE